MALVCNVTLNSASMTAGQTPPPMATLTVYNPNAVPVLVTGVQMQAQALGDVVAGHVPLGPSVVPIGPGMSIQLAALSSITIGPFPVTIPSVGASNQFQSVNQTGNLNPINPQGSQPPQATFMIGATVYGSDGSVNIAGAAPILVDVAVRSPLGLQGGFAVFTNPANAANLIPLGVL